MKGWTITWGEHVFTDEDATTANLIAVSDLLGDDWNNISPWNGPRVLAAWLAVLLATKSGDLDAALSVVYRMSVRELGDCLDDRVLTEPPVVAVPAA